MMYGKLLLCITAIAYLFVQINAGDPLDPSLLGESMSTGMDLGLVQQAKEAGIIKESNPLYNSVSGQSATYLGSTPPAGAAGAGAQAANEPVVDDPTTIVPDQSEQDVNVTGVWSLDLSGRSAGHIDLNMVQNKDAIMGNGIMTGDNGTQKITASGTLTGNGLSLTVMPVGSLDLYRLDLSLDSETTGTYTAYSADGNSWSGGVSGTAPPGISTTAPDIIKADLNGAEVAGAGAETAGADTESPIRIGAAKSAAAASAGASIGSGSASLSQGFSGSSSSSTSVSMVSSSGSSGMQSFSSMSGSI